MRVMVDVDTLQPLRRWKKIAQRTGESCVVNFKYEKLSTFCFVCGILGHTERFCEVRFSTAEGDLKRDWGLFLKAPDRRVKQQPTCKWLRDDRGSDGDSGDGNGGLSRDEGDRGQFVGQAVPTTVGPQVQNIWFLVRQKHLQRRT
ncbi:hypothetical protein ACS0TY_017333 [Phlomoides rotata]